MSEIETAQLELMRIFKQFIVNINCLKMKQNGNITKKINVQEYKSNITKTHTAKEK